MQDRELREFVILTGVFSGCLAIAAVLAGKIINVFGLSVPAGVIAYCFTFICTDVISEIHGRKKAGMTVFSGFISLVLVFLLIQVALWWEPAPFWKHGQAFNTILGYTPRIIIGSLAAYLLSQYHDVWLFHLVRRITGGRHLWLRNNLSTAASQLIDSAVFISIAFYGIMPVWPLILGQWVIKLAIAVLDTPLVYLIVRLMRSRQTSLPAHAAGTGAD